MKKHLNSIYRKTNQEDKSKYEYVLTQNERNHSIDSDLLNKFFNSLNQKDICFYPNTENLKSKISKYFNIGQSNLLLTPGSSFSIKTIFETFDVKDKNVITSDYFFPMYQVYSDLYQCTLKKAKYSGMKLRTTDLINLIDRNTKFIILANPNSPLGDTYNLTDILELLNTGIYVVIDEAYIEFTDQPSVVSLVDKHKNLIVTKTFSKAYGAAGCRTGFLVSCEENIEILSKFRLMYEINSIGVKYTEFILDNIDYFNSYIEETKDNKKFLVNKLKSKDFEIIDTDASWFFLKRYSNIDNLKYFNDLGISLRTLILPNGHEYIKFNYDLKLKNLF